MLQSDVERSRTIGADLRALRKARDLTLQELADRIERSVGWLSQVERDLSEPSLTDLRLLAGELDVSISTLFRHDAAPVDEAGLVVRSKARRPIGSRSAGLVEELLSPDLTDDFEMVHCIFEAHSEIPEMLTRPTQEVAYLVSGKLEITIGDKHFSLKAGDSFRIRGEKFRWSNPYDKAAVAIWVIAPPVY